MPHDHSMPGSFDHIKVIAAVSECIDFIISQMQFFLYVLNCSCLGILFLYTFIDTSQTVDMVKYIFCFFKESFSICHLIYIDQYLIKIIACIFHCLFSSKPKSCHIPSAAFYRLQSGDPVRIIDILCSFQKSFYFTVLHAFNNFTSSFIGNRMMKHNLFSIDQMRSASTQESIK